MIQPNTQLYQPMLPPMVLVRCYNNARRIENQDQLLLYHDPSQLLKEDEKEALGLT